MLTGSHLVLAHVFSWLKCWCWSVHDEFIFILFLSLSVCVCSVLSFHILLSFAHSLKKRNTRQPLTHSHVHDPVLCCVGVPYLTNKKFSTPPPLSVSSTLCSVFFLFCFVPVTWALPCSSAVMRWLACAIHDIISNSVGLHCLVEEWNWAELHVNHPANPHATGQSQCKAKLWNEVLLIFQKTCFFCPA